MSKLDPKLDPDEEQAIQALLRAARVREPMPAEVTDRLTAALANEKPPRRTKSSKRTAAEKGSRSSDRTRTGDRSRTADAKTRSAKRKPANAELGETDSQKTTDWVRTEQGSRPGKSGLPDTGSTQTGSPGLGLTGPDVTGPEVTGLGLTGPDVTGPHSSEPVEITPRRRAASRVPNKALPNKALPNKARPNKSRPNKAVPNKAVTWLVAAAAVVLGGVLIVPRLTGGQGDASSADSAGQAADERADSAPDSTEPEFDEALPPSVEEVAFDDVAPDLYADFLADPTSARNSATDKLAGDCKLPRRLRKWDSIDVLVVGQPGWVVFKERNSGAIVATLHTCISGKKPIERTRFRPS